MSQPKTILKEFLTDPKAVKEARANPIPQPEIDRSMNFIRSLVLDVPLQTGGKIDTETKTVVETETIDSGLDNIKRLAGIK
jgi:hypothetical protein